MADKFRILSNWFAQPLGDAVAISIKEQLALQLRNLTIQNLLQLGLEQQIDWFNFNRSMRKYLVTPYFTTSNCNVIADCELLPFDSSSFNLVFLPITLELFDDITPLLNEVTRVLAGDGYVLICGINPISWWGLAKLLDKQDVFPTPQSHLRSSLTVRNLLVSLGYQVCWIKSFFYRVPAVSATTLKNMEFLEQMGKMLWPYPGGIYMILAQKRESQLLAIKPLWHFRRYVIGKEFAQPTVRGF